MSFLKSDVHAHMIPSFFRDACLHSALRFGPRDNDEKSALVAHYCPPWSASSHLAFNASASIRKSYLSIAAPGPYIINPAQGVALTRRVNDYGSALACAHPSRFAYLACLPLGAPPQTNVIATVAEIERCVSELRNIAGFVLFTETEMTSALDEYGDVFAALEKFHAVVLFHPLSTCVSMRSQFVKPQFANAESFAHIPSQAAADDVVNLLLSRVCERWPGLKFVIPHAGELWPLVLTRLGFGSEDGTSSREEMPTQIGALLAMNFYLDLSGNPPAAQIRGLLNWVDHTRLLFGSDAPLIPFDAAVENEGNFAEELMEIFGGESGANECLRVCNGNAARLFEKDVVR